MHPGAQREVDVRTRTPVARRGFRHERDEHAVPLGDLLEREAQEDQPVGHLQQIRVVEVEFELGVGALGDDVVQVPAQALQHVHHVLEEGHGVQGVLDVVAVGLPARTQAADLLGIAVEGLHRLAVLVPAHHDELGLDAGVSGVTLLRRFMNGAFEGLPRATLYGLSSQNGSAKMMAVLVSHGQMYTASRSGTGI